MEYLSMATVSCDGGKIETQGCGQGRLEVLILGGSNCEEVMGGGLEVLILGGQHQ